MITAKNIIELIEKDLQYLTT